MKTVIAVIFVFFCAWAGAATADTPEDFPLFVAQMKQLAQEKGIRDNTIEAAFRDVRFIKRVVKQDRNQPEFKITMEDYLKTRVPEWKVAKARALYKKHQALLTEIGQEYKVQPRFIVALWGLETNFGSYTGKIDIISALTTMTYEGRRRDFFRKELMAALEILDQEHISVDRMIGSWAGAMGQSQFMPTSFLAYAVDYDGDGRKDIWSNLPDVFASIANYLKQAGWNEELTWGRQVKIPSNFDESLAGLKNKRRLPEWQALGVRRYDGQDLPSRDIEAAIVMADGIDGRIYLAYHNYSVLMRWNRSNYFVTSVGSLSDRIKYPPVQ